MRFFLGMKVAMKTVMMILMLSVRKKVVLRGKMKIVNRILEKLSALKSAKRKKEKRPGFLVLLWRLLPKTLFPFVSRMNTLFDRLRMLDSK